MLFYVVQATRPTSSAHRLFDDRKRSWPSPSLSEQPRCDSPTASFLHHIVLSTRHPPSFSAILPIIFASGQRHAIECVNIHTFWNRIQILLLLGLSIVIIEERNISKKTSRESLQKEIPFFHPKKYMNFIYLIYIYI